MKNAMIEYPLFPAQKWILKNIMPPHHWNISYMLFLENRYNPVILKEVLDDIVNRHEVFKLRFIIKNNAIFQQFDPDQTNCYHFTEMEITDNDHHEKSIIRFMENVQQSIHIFNGPLFSVGLIKTPQGDHLYIVVHHLISDAYSFKLLVYDLISGYMKRLKNNQKYNPRPTASFLQAVENIYRYSIYNQLEAEIKYWKKILKTKTGHLPINSYITREQKIEIFNSDIYDTVLDKNLLEKLKNILTRIKTGEYELYLSILGLSLCDWIKDKKTFVKLVHHGRNNFTGGLNLHRTLGPFWITYPFILDNNDRNNCLKRARKIKKQLTGVPHHGRGYEVLKEIILETDPEFNKLDRAVPNILFNYYGKMNENFVIDPEFGQLSPYFRDLNRDKTAFCDFTLIFNLREIDNCLKLQLIYNKIEFNHDNINNLFRHFLNNLNLSIKELSGNLVTTQV